MFQLGRENECLFLLGRERERKGERERMFQLGRENECFFLLEKEREGFFLERERERERERVDFFLERERERETEWMFQLGREN